MTRTLEAAVVAVALLAVLGGCRTMTGRTAGQTLDNAATVASVKAKLTTDRLANLTWVDVDANDGVVYLNGNAATPEQKARATELAMRAKGVRRVVNEIVVNPPTGAKAQPAKGAPAASPVTAPAGAVTGEVVSLDQGSGSVTLRMTDGNTVQLRLPPASLTNVKTGDRLSVSVRPMAP